MITVIAMPKDLPAEVGFPSSAAWFIAFVSEELNAVGFGVVPVVGGSGLLSSDALPVTTVVVVDIVEVVVVVVVVVCQINARKGLKSENELLQLTW